MPEGGRIKWRIAVGLGFVLDLISGQRANVWASDHWLAAHYGTGVKPSTVNNVETAKHGYSVAHRKWQPFPLFFSLPCLLSFHNQCSSMLLMLCNYSTPVAEGGRKSERAHSSKAPPPPPRRTRSYLPPLPSIQPPASELREAPLQRANRSIISTAPQKRRIGSFAGGKGKVGSKVFRRTYGGDGDACARRTHLDLNSARGTWPFTLFLYEGCQHRIVWDDLQAMFSGFNLILTHVIT